MNEYSLEKVQSFHLHTIIYGLTIDESHASQPLPSFDKHPQLSGQVSLLQHRTTLLQNRWKCHSDGDFR